MLFRSPFDHWIFNEVFSNNTVKELAELEIAIAMEKVKKRKEVFTKAQQAAEERVLEAMVGNKASIATQESFRKRLRNGDLDKNEIEIDVQEGPSMPSFEIPGMPGANVGMVNIGEMCILKFNF